MSKLAETPDEAVKRIAGRFQDNLGDVLSLAHEYAELDAAIRQGIAWAYRDAARIADEQKAKYSPYYDNPMDTMATGVAATIAAAIRAKAEEVTRG